MIFAKDKNYKVTEIDRALIISDTWLNIGLGSKEHPAQPLMIGGAGPVLTYLDRFFFEREKGADLRTAHDLAMKTAGITAIVPKGTTILG